MPIQIKAPDGSIAQFPDGMADAGIEKVMAQHYPAQNSAPRWDILGDIGRAASNSAKAVGDDFGATFPDVKTMDFGPVASLKRMGSALKVPLDAAGVALSPITGALHGTLGSALSYALPRVPQGKEADFEKASGMSADPKLAADSLIDQSMAMLAPKGMENPIALSQAGAARQATGIARSEAKLKNRAIERVNTRLQDDGITPQDVFTAQQQANASGDKVTLMDLGNKNTKGLAGAVYRAPGSAGREINQFLDARDADATSALAGDIQGSVGSGSAYQSTQDLYKARSAASAEPYRAALESDSVAPFETQYRQAVIDANSRKAQIGKQIAQIEREQSGALASRGAAGKATRDKYMQLREDFDGADAERAAWDARWKEAQSDRTSNAPGAVWSPRLQQFIDHPEVQSGLRQGLKLEKQDAITQRRTYKDSDFSIVGHDERGEPILGQVPTMKSLAVAKEGLDARIAELVDPVTRRPTKAGLSLKNFRNEFVSELDRLNPNYKNARAAWSGPSQTLEAVEEGKAHFTRPESNEQVLAEFNQLSESDKDFYRASAAESKVDALERAPDASDKSKRVINNERDRKRFRMLFKSDVEANNFINAVARKRAAFETKSAIKGGSQTAGRIADDANEGVPLAFDAVHGLGHAAAGNWLGAAQAAYRMKRDLGLRNNPELNSEIAKLLTDHSLPVHDLPRILKPLPVPKYNGHLPPPIIPGGLFGMTAGSKK